jgi:uncharacterized RDD family membrane protein YckC
MADPGERNLVRCDITGQMVPEDEIVEIQGYRVCAAGKQELLDRLQSGERMPGELERPTVLRRFGCAFVDGLLLALLGMVVNIAIGIPAINTEGYTQRMVDRVVFAGVIGTLMGMSYFTLFHGLRGQTLGKMAGKCKVVRPDGSDIGVSRAFVRWLCFVGPQVVSPFTPYFGSIEAVQTFGLVAGGYSIINILFLLLDRDQNRALHDRLAGTRVISID